MKSVYSIFLLFLCISPIQSADKPAESVKLASVILRPKAIPTDAVYEHFPQTEGDDELPRISNNKRFNKECALPPANTTYFTWQPGPEPKDC